MQQTPGVDVGVVQEQPIRVETQSIDAGPSIDVGVAVSEALTGGVSRVRVWWDDQVLGSTPISVSPGEQRTTVVPIDQSKVRPFRGREEERWLVQALSGDHVFATEPVEIEIVEVTDAELEERRKAERRERERRREQQRPDGFLDRLDAAMEAEAARRKRRRSR